MLFQNYKIKIENIITLMNKYLQEQKLNNKETKNLKQKSNKIKI